MLYTTAFLFTDKLLSSCSKYSDKNVDQIKLMMKFISFYNFQ